MKISSMPVVYSSEGGKNRMAFRSVGINLPHLHLDGVSRLIEDLEVLKSVGPDFVEI
jgi:hypothetical protein